MLQMMVTVVSKYNFSNGDDQLITADNFCLSRKYEGCVFHLWKAPEKKDTQIWRNVVFMMGSKIEIEVDC